MSKPPNLPKALKFSLFRKDPSRRVHFIHSANLGSDLQRFEKFQHRILNQGILELKEASLVLACIPAFEGLAIETDIQNAYIACKSAYHWEHGVRIDWQDGINSNARNLSAFTVLALRRVSVWPTYEEAKASVIEFLAIADVNQHAQNSPMPWDALLAGAMSWLQFKLSPIYFGHVSKSAPLSALPRNALARKETLLALVVPELSDSTEISVTQTAYVRAFEAAVLGRKPSALTGALFLRKLITALTPPTKGSDASKRSKVLRNLHVLAAEIDDADEISALLFVFALDLVVTGTRRKSQLAPATPYHYVHSIAEDLHSAANCQSLSNIDIEVYAGIFQKLLPSSGTFAPYKLAALKAFHQFLRACWDVPPLPAGIFGAETESPVAANVIWPHELDRMNEWFVAAEDSRFVQQLKTGLAVASHAMIRISELLVLERINVCDEGDHLVIEIARAIRDGSEKSSEGRRRVTIKDPQAIAQIGSWCTRRAQEENGIGGYLFGDPSEPSKLAHPGKMYFWLNHLLKSVTGDEDVSVHTLRHSIATQRFVSIEQDVGDCEVNPMDVLANEAGHIGGHITAHSYIHLFESGIRHALDTGLAEQTTDYAAISRWTGVSEATLRQRVSRSSADFSRGEILLQVVKECASKVTFPTVGQSFPVQLPVNPLLTLNRAPTNYRQVCGTLLDIAQGMSSSQAALGQDLDESFVADMLKIVGDFADRHGRGSSQLPDLTALGVLALRDSSGELLGLRPDFSRMAQPRWQLLARAAERCDIATLHSAVHYWERSISGHHLAVRPGPQWDHFVNLLQQSGINASLYALKYVPSSTPDTDNPVALAQASFRRHFGRSVRQIEQKARGGRPGIWLVIGSDAAFLDKEGSAASQSGLHCALLAAYVWTRLLQKTEV